MTPEREALRQLVYRIRQRSTNKLHNREYQMTLDDCVRELAALSAAPREPGPCPKCGCDSYIAGAPSWKYDEKWSAVASVTCDKCDHEWDIDLALRREAPAPAEGKGTSVTEDQIKHMVDRFLGWKLPENFNPDGGVSFKRLENRHHHPDAPPFYPMPTGTNLFDAMQATEMVRYMISGMPARPDTAETRLREALTSLHEAILTLSKFGKNNVTLFEDSLLENQECFDAWLRLNTAQTKAAEVLGPPFKLRFSSGWLASKIKSDPDIETDTGEALSPPSGGDEAKGSEGAKLLPCPVCGGEAIHAIETLKRTIIKADPSEPDRREIVALDEAKESDKTGMRVEDKPRSHGESLQYGPDTSSSSSTAATPHGKGSDAASVAIPVASSDLLVSQEAPVLSEPSPPADRREIVARIIDPSSWAVLDGYLEDAKRKFRGQHIGWPEDQFKDKWSLAKADAILAALDGGR